MSNENDGTWCISDGETQCRVEQMGDTIFLLAGNNGKNTPEEEQLWETFLRRDTSQEIETFENGMSIVPCPTLNGETKYIGVASTRLSQEELAIIKNRNAQSQNTEKANDVIVIPGNNEVQVLSTTFWLYSQTASQKEAGNGYNKPPSHFIPITATNGEFDLHTIPEDLRDSLSKITPKRLEEQQNQAKLQGNSFMSITGKNLYFLIHPDEIYKGGSEPTQLGELGRKLLRWQPSNLPRVQIPKTNTTNSNNYNPKTPCLEL